MKYSIVIPTYNHCEDLLKPCIESIFRHTDMTEVELIISANGCLDSTGDYLKGLRQAFNQVGFPTHLTVVWNSMPLGYAKATNAGIQAAKGEYIVLLNNDTVMLEQPRKEWLKMLSKPFEDPRCGISCVLKSKPVVTGNDFAIFFCVMIHRRVFDTIGLISTDFGVGGCEDIAFCADAERAGFMIHECAPKSFKDQQFVGVFPSYHKGEGTVLDSELIYDYRTTFELNTLKLAQKYNPDWYRWKLSNNYERAVFLKGDEVFPREKTRYEWAAKHVEGLSVLEVGCSTGYGLQFMPQGVHYTGLDYDPIIVKVAQEQAWSPNAQFMHADINKVELGQYDTIIAFEVIEHLDNGLDVLQKLKKNCSNLLFTVPLNEPQGFWGPHHKLHGLNESHFPGFAFDYIDEHGAITAEPVPICERNRCNLLIGRWHA